LGNALLVFVGIFTLETRKVKRVSYEKQMFQIYANLPMLITNNQSLPLPKNRICERKPVLFSPDDFI